jgi:predicted metallo-beta-lactamase superfamily hydrolase
MLQSIQRALTIKIFVLSYKKDRFPPLHRIKYEKQVCSGAKVNPDKKVRIKSPDRKINKLPVRA